MQKLIDGKLYDTDDAEKVASYSTGGSMSDFGYYREALYRTPNGNWFLHGEGHARTKYGSTTPDGMRGWGSDIIALTDEEAFRWCERTDRIDAAQEHFSEFFEAV